MPLFHCIGNCVVACDEQRVFAEVQSAVWVGKLAPFSSRHISPGMEAWNALICNLFTNLIYFKKTLKNHMLYDIIYPVYLYAEDPKLKDDMIKNNELLVEEPKENAAEEEVLQFRRPKKVIKKKRLLIVLLIIIGLVAAAVGTFVALKLMKPEEGYDDSAAFYFDSNLLSEDGNKEPKVLCDTIDFEVRNYADSLRVSKEPIEDFTITVMVDGRDITPKADIIVDERSMAPDIRCESTVSVSVPEKYREEVIDIIVVSSPIEKELKGSFRLEPAWGYEFKDEKDNICADLVIYANKDITLELSWDGEKLIADSTDSYIRTANAGETKCLVELSAGTSTTIAMFKADPSKDLSKEDVVTLKLVSDTTSEDSSELTEDTYPESEALDTETTTETTEETQEAA